MTAYLYILHNKKFESIVTWVFVKKKTLIDNKAQGGLQSSCSIILTAKGSTSYKKGIIYLGYQSCFFSTGLPCGFLAK